MPSTRKKIITLSSIIFTLVIIAIFTNYVLFRFSACASDDQICHAKYDVRVLEASLELYRLDNYQYPTSDQGLGALLKKPSDDNAPNWRDGGYIKILKKDPWGNDYRYRYPGFNSQFDVFSLGADGAVGGEGGNSDIGNWNLDS